MDAVFFESQTAFRTWLTDNYNKASEQWVGFYKKSAGKVGITYAEALDEALCFGWIDGVRKSIDEAHWMIRFSPRQRSSIWSDVNIKRIGELIEMGQMHPHGLKVFEERDPKKMKQYSNEQADLRFDSAHEAQFKANAAAWDYFQSAALSYQKAAIWWVISAKKEETRLKRLDQLIADSAQGKTVPPLTRPKS